MYYSRVTMRECHVAYYNIIHVGKSTTPPKSKLCQRDDGTEIDTVNIK